MEIALYGEGGYYQNHLPKIGKHGDYITAPEISPYFARCLARQCHQILLNLPPESSLLEIGGGSGTLSVEILKTLESLHTLPAHYYFLEISEAFKNQQQHLIKTTLPHLFERCRWIDHIPIPFEGIVFANEWLDALPVHRFRITAKGICSLCVEFNKENGFQWIETPPTKDEIEKIAMRVKTTYGLEPGYTSEINLTIQDWMTEFSQAIEQGVLLFIDYGYPEHEYYHPQRKDGTLKCFYQHKSHEDPFYRPGEQDITAHVNFSQVAECAEQVGLHVSGFTTQALFLLACGITEGGEGGISKSQQIQWLTHPAEMGEVYKVMALSKNYNYPLLGFSLRDMREKL